MSFKINILASSLLLSGCGVPIIPGITPHKIEIQQGNIVTQEMLDKLEPGMTRNQVRYVLGTPLIMDPFRTDRWDYVYTMNRRGLDVERKQLKVYFDGDRMVRYEGDVLAETKPGDIATAGRPVAKVAEKPVAKPPAAVLAVKPAETPAQKPVAQPVTPPPAPVANASVAPPLAAASATAPAVNEAENKPLLRLAPSEGQVATPAEKIAVQPAPKPAAANSIESPPLPRIELGPVEAAAAAASTTAPPASVAASAAAASPSASSTATPATPAAPAVVVAPVVAAPPQVPAVVAKPSPVVAAPAVAVEKPAPKPAPVVAAAKPATNPAVTPAAKPATGGWFSNLFSAPSTPSRQYNFGTNREAGPGSAPAPFYDTPEEQAAATGGTVNR